MSVKIKSLLRNENIYPVELLNRLINENSLGVTLEKLEEFLSENIRPSEGDSQTVCLLLFLELRKHGLSNGWKWVKGINKRDKGRAVMHSWLQYEDIVVDPLPGFKFESSFFGPGDILIMERKEFLLKTGFSVSSEKKEKLVMRWIEKNNAKYGD